MAGRPALLLPRSFFLERDGRKRRENGGGRRKRREEGRCGVYI